ncbi:DUF308 domain-containing protein [Candidatus Saccharibacteria bacterium]|nr:DUF308 domain-containing protein [Candidatus Saccharibacteria bacterium]
MTTPRKYIDSHWLIFAFQGVIALLFGWFVMFTGLTDTTALVATVGAFLLGLGAVELFNMLRRTHVKETWGLSLFVAVFEIAVALALLFTLNQNIALHLAIIAGYTIVRGIFEILIGIKSIDDSTDKLIWTICGICGVIMGFVILNSGTLGYPNTFLQFFGAYMMVFGLCNLIYGVHNRDQKHTAKLERRQVATRRAQKKVVKKNVKKTKHVKKVTAKAKSKAKKTTKRK